MILKIRAVASGWGILLLFVFLLGCAHQPPKNSLSITHQPEPVYRIGKGDVIEIKFFDNDRFSRSVTVRPDGRITLEKIGDIYVAGLTTAEVDSIITDKYQGILKSPDVTIFVNHFSNQKVYVMGEVQKPGGYLVERDMTVTQAIVLAGGFNRSAKKNSVLLIRKQPNGQLYAARINLKHILSATPQAMDEQIQALDIVYVPRTFVANIDEFMNQFFDIIMPPVDVYWRIWFMEQVNSNN
jgi:protein involved in polysaccharide export with SLBB domain